MVIDMDGQVIRPVTTLAFNFQLPFADDVMVKDGKIVAYASWIPMVVWCQDCATEDGDGSKPSTTPTSHSFIICIYLHIFANLTGHIHPYLATILI